MKYLLIYSTNEIKQEQILKENERLGIFVPLPKERKRPFVKLN